MSVWTVQSVVSVTEVVELYGGPHDGLKARVSSEKLESGKVKIPISHYYAIYGNRSGKWEFYGYDIDEQSNEPGKSST